MEYTQQKWWTISEILDSFNLWKTKTWRLILYNIFSRLCTLFWTDLMKIVNFQQDFRFIRLLEDQKVNCNFQSIFFTFGTPLQLDTRSIQKCRGWVLSESPDFSNSKVCKYLYFLDFVTFYWFLFRTLLYLSPRPGLSLDCSPSAGVLRSFFSPSCC